MNTDLNHRTMAQESPGGIITTMRAGAVAGFAATVPMTMAMELMHRRLPWWERYPLPPSQIVSRLAKAVGLRKHMDRQEHVAVTMASHFSYGAVAGAGYALVARPLPLPAALKGILFGLVVWTVSYLGLLPSAQILPSATEQPQRRNALMIAAHVVWGLAVGTLVERLQDRGR